MTSQTKQINSETGARYKESFNLKRFLRTYGTQFGILTVFAAMWSFFIIMAPDTFLSAPIYYAYMSTIPFFAMIAMPLTILIIAGEIDLSFTSIMAMGMIMFILTYNATQSVWLAFIVSLVTGLFIGWLNGIIVVKFGIPSLVATIGTQFFWRGAVLVLSQGKSGTLVYTKDTLLYPLLVGKIGGVFPVQMLWLIFIAVGSWVLLNRHQFGAHMYLIGDNPNSAKLMGVN
ncbi:MAG: ABC transporter permease, partial [Anaerolineales bacterium]